MTFGLRPSDWRTFEEAFNSFHVIDKVVLFGSRAISKHRKGSDVDLAILGEDVNFDTVAKLHSLLEEESVLPYFFDVVDYSHLNHGDFKDHIKRVGVEIFVRNSLAPKRANIDKHEVLLLRSHPEIQSLKGAFVSLNFEKMLDFVKFHKIHEKISPLNHYADDLLKTYSSPFAQYFPLENQNFVNELILIYQMYWWNSFLSRRTFEERDSTLFNQLIELLHSQKGGDANCENFEDVECALQSNLKALGYGALFGTTAPLREMLIWKTNEERNYKISLVEGNVDVPVSLLGDFLSLGWMGYLSKNVWHTAGWTTSNRIYVVQDAYEDLNSEEFHVSLLMHEGQHLMDLQRFPSMSQVELEYRAKLSELSFAQATLRNLIYKFSGEADPNSNSPHAEAAYNVLKNITIKITGSETIEPTVFANTSLEVIQNSARELIEEGTIRF